MRKETLDEKISNGGITRKIERLFTQLLGKGERSAPHTPISKNSYASKLYDYHTTIKDDTLTKPKVTKGLSNHNMANKLSSKGLQHMFNSWGLIYMAFITREWYLQTWISFIHPFKDIQRSGDVNMDIKKTKYRNQATKEKFQQKFRHMKLIIQRKNQRDQKPINTIFLATITRVKSYFDIYWRGPHKADPKRVKEPQYNSTSLVSKSNKISVQIMSGTTPNSPRTTTNLTTFIMSYTRALNLIQSPLRIQKQHLNLRLRFALCKEFVVHKEFAVVDTVSRVRPTVCAQSTMRTPTKEKEKATQLRAVEDVVFSTEMAALDFKPTLEEETFLQLIGLDRFVTRVVWEIVNIPVVQEIIANSNIDTMESVLNGQPFAIFPKDWRNKMRAVFYLTEFSARNAKGQAGGHLS